MELLLNGIASLKPTVAAIKRSVSRESGLIKVDAKPEVVFETPISAVIDAHSAMGQLVGHQAMQMAIEKAKVLLEDVGLSDRMNHLPNELSGGERQRVAVARSLINDPQLILADEPTGNLDPANATVISDLLFSMVEKHNKTLILVTHDQKIAQKGDFCYSIKDGQLVEV